MRAAFDDLVFDGDRRTLTRNGDAVHLTPKAFDLLTVLIAARPRVIATEQLFDHLWPETLVDTSSLHKLVHELRSVLGDDDRRMIRTSYGRGFSFGIPAIDLDATPKSTYELLVEGRRVVLCEGENIVGRDRDVAVHVDEHDVSRRHARILVDGDRVSIEDLGSKNGTFVDGQRIHAPVPVTPTAKILIAKLKATLVLNSPADSTASAG